MKKQQIATRIILGITVLALVIPFSQFTFPQTAFSASNTGLNWSNPNANGDNPYKVTTDSILNASTMLQVVGCTGIVNTVSGAITDFLKDKAASLLNLKATKEAILAKACAAGKGTLEAPTGLFPNLTVSQAISDGYVCPSIQKTESTKTEGKLDEVKKELTSTEKREACFNGLAYTLAKNQLTSMTRETVNWVNQGFDGNPLYVQNIRALTNSIERNVIETGIDVIANGAFPYGGDFNNTLIKSYNGGVMNGAAKYLDSLASDLSYFLTDTTSYTNYDASDTNYARQRAMQANNAFSNDFAVGGWDGYLALTQRDQNNPLGFTMAASQYLADRIDQQANTTKDEVMQNNGFLSQKECILWQVYNEDTQKPLTEKTGKMLMAGITLPDGTKTEGIPETKSVTSPTQKTTYDKCIDWKVTTPGSLIKDKLTTYINSPERQLELADTINKSLNSLFTRLIENFRSEGLFGLSQEKYTAIDSMGGYGSNITGVDAELGSGYSPSYYANGSGYSNDSFDLTRDLGNTYIHDATRSFGKFNASTCRITSGINEGQYLNVDLGMREGNDGAYYPSYYYYTVETPGNCKLFNNGYSGWAVGDRAFWDGDEWQNWKNGQISPIAVRGIVQTQQDYIVAAKEILKKLPGIMPKLGELDYCIPGPNPNFEQNTADTSTAFNEYAGTLAGTYDTGSFFVRNSTAWTISRPGNTKYENYAGIFKDTPTLFDAIKKTVPWTSLQILGSGKTIKKNTDEERMQAEVDSLLNQIQEDIKTFYKDYQTDIFDDVYGTMRSEYNEKENTSELSKNSAYVPMIEDGYNATKNIVSEAEDIATQTQDYRDAIIQAQSNISKLNIIKSEVSKIIKAAQVRRDNDPNFINALLKQYEGKTLEQAKALYAQYKINNKECFDEEDISYYDDGDIMVDNASEEGRCKDGLDNDLDGLIDTKDPDCATQNLTPTVKIEVYPKTVSKTKTIRWTTTNANTCTFSNGELDSEGNVKEVTVETNGSREESPTQDTVYTINCKGDSGISKGSSVLVSVKGILPYLSQDKE